ncbi:MAG: RDD family protein, partial [Phycisphaerae bacterium]
MSEDKPSSAQLPRVRRCEITGEQLPSNELIRFRGKWVSEKGKQILLDRLLSGEELDITWVAATIGRRFGAFCLDWAPLLIIVLTWLVLAYAGHNFIFFCTITFALFLLVVAYFGFQIGRTGQTWGKKVVGIKVITRKGEPLGVPRGLTRSVFYALPLVLVSLTFIGLTFPTLGAASAMESVLRQRDESSLRVDVPARSR